jgi:DNA polymerase-3 subunit alpha (Gram-positive type)
MIEDYVVIDLEMTGLKVKYDAILEVGACRVRCGEVTDTFSALLNAKREISDEITQITGITREMAVSGMDPEEAMPQYFAFLGDDVIVGHNVIYDYSFLKQWAVNHNFTFERNAIDTLKLARRLLPEEQKKDLASLCVYFDVSRENAHRALDDAIATAQIYERLKLMSTQENAGIFEPKPLHYKVKKQTAVTAKQIEYLHRYADAYGLELPEYIESLTRSEASRIIDGWILEHGKL